MSSPSPEELEPYLQFAISLGKRAGELIKAGQAKRFSNKSGLDVKHNSIDVSPPTTHITTLERWS